MRIKTTIIDLAGPRPIKVDLEAIPDTYAYSGRTFTRQQLSIVGGALNAGIFYADEFEGACRGAWEAAYPVVDTCLTALDGRNWQPAIGDFQSRRTQIHAIEQRLQQEPRGTWAILRREWARDDGVVFVDWIVRISNGFGGTYAPQTSHLKSEPDHAYAVSKMTGYEIYSARCAEEFRRSIIESQQALSREGWKVGSRIKNLSIAGTRFASAVIESINENHAVTLMLTKRGSAKRWTWTGLAQGINIKPSSIKRVDATAVAA